MTDALTLHRSPLLSEFPHAFVGRTGGVSTGVVASLNVGLGADDAAAAVAENRRCVVDAVMPGGTLVTLYQIHSNQVVRVLSALKDGERPEGDALVTERPGFLLGILTADCTPVLFADPVARVIGAAHAGWKGALSGVTDRTIEAMVKAGADPARMVAAIGPVIAQKSYEVDDAFLRRFCTEAPENERFFVSGRRADHWQFDLEGYVAARLAAAGVARVDMPGLDTYALEDRYFSYRRATHRGEATYGRQISVIGLPPA